MAQPTTSQPSAEAELELESRIRLLRRISIAEATSFLILLVATVVKRTQGNEFGVELMGPIHGALFLIYAFLMIRDRRHLGWPVWQTVAAIFLGSVPFGGFWVERRWLANRP